MSLMDAPALASEPRPFAADSRAFVTPFGEFLGANVRANFNMTSPVLAARAVDRMGDMTGALVNPDDGESDRVAMVPQDRVMTEEEWKNSPSFRGNLDYDPDRMTEGYAKTIADQRDAVEYRNWLVGQGDHGVVRGAAGFLAGVAGGLPDPLNLIPFAGPAWRAASIARFGTVGGRALMGAADAAIGQALVEPLQLYDRSVHGEDVHWSDAVMDLAMAGAAGGAIGGGHGLIRKLKGLKEEPVLTIDQQRAAGRALNDAVASLAMGDHVAVRPEHLDSVRDVRDQLLGAGREADAVERVKRLGDEERARIIEALPEADHAAYRDLEAKAGAAEDLTAAARLKEAADRILARDMAAKDLAPDRVDTSNPLPKPDPSVREAEKSVGRPETMQDTAKRVLGEESLGGEAPKLGEKPKAEGQPEPQAAREPAEIRELREAGRMTPEMEKDFRVADEAATKTERVADALEAAAACMVRAA